MPTPNQYISNTSCLIVLDNIGLLDILKDLYQTIFITTEVHQEFGKKIPPWIQIKDVKDSRRIEILNQIIDLGEASTIALSMDMDSSILILDDLKARKAAKNLNLSMTGTLGVLMKAYEKGFIQSLTEIIRLLKDEGFRISDNLEERMVRLESDKQKQDKS